VCKLLLILAGLTLNQACAARQPEKLPFNKSAPQSYAPYCFAGRIAYESREQEFLACTETLSLCERAKLMADRYARFTQVTATGDCFNQEELYGQE
jgi:hypothetical protein